MGTRHSQDLSRPREQTEGVRTLKAGLPRGKVRPRRRRRFGQCKRGLSSGSGREGKKGTLENRTEVTHVRGQQVVAEGENKVPCEPDKGLHHRLAWFLLHIHFYMLSVLLCLARTRARAHTHLRTHAKTVRTRHTRTRSSTQDLTTMATRARARAAVNTLMDTHAHTRGLTWTRAQTQILQKGAKRANKEDLPKFLRRRKEKSDAR